MWEFLITEFRFSEVILVHTVQERTVTVNHNWSLAGRLICTPTLLKGLSSRGSGELIKPMPFWRAEDSRIKLTWFGRWVWWLDNCPSVHLTFSDLRLLSKGYKLNLLYPETSCRCGEGWCVNERDVKREISPWVRFHSAAIIHAALKCKQQLCVQEVKGHYAFKGFVT